MKLRLATFISISAMLLGACARRTEPAERPTPVQVQAVQSFSGKDVKRFSAVVQPYEQVELSFRAGGYVQSIAQMRGVEGHARALQDGDHVAAGAVLARLHSVDYGARVDQAKASLAEAETQLGKAQLDRARATKLYESQSLTKPDYDAAIANHDAAQARVLSARGRLTEVATSSSDTVLRAPFSGTILKRNIALGTLASPGVPAFVVADTKVMKAVFGVPDMLIPMMKLGNPLALRADAFSDVELHGRISRIAAAADPKSRVFEVEVSIPNPKDELKIGMITSLVLEQQVPELGSPVVPISALVTSPNRPGGYALFVSTQEKGATIARLREVEIGRTLGNLVVIKNGPQLGDQVITAGAGLLRDGEPIEIINPSANVISKK